MWWNGKLKTGHGRQTGFINGLLSTALDAADIRIPCFSETRWCVMLLYVQKGADKKSAAGEPHKYLSDYLYSHWWDEENTAFLGTDIINS